MGPTTSLKPRVPDTAGQSGPETEELRAELHLKPSGAVGRGLGAGACRQNGSRGPAVILQKGNWCPWHADLWGQNRGQSSVLLALMELTTMGENR